MLTVPIKLLKNSNTPATFTFRCICFHRVNRIGESKNFTLSNSSTRDVCVVKTVCNNYPYLSSWPLNANRKRVVPSFHVNPVGVFFVAYLVKLAPPYGRSLKRIAWDERPNGGRQRNIDTVKFNGLIYDRHKSSVTSRTTLHTG